MINGSYGLLGIIHLILFVYALLDILGSNMDGVSKILWILIVFFLPVIGLILYFLVAKR